MSLSALSDQWPAIAVLLLFVGVLLKTLQSQYDARLADRDARLADKDALNRAITADRDAWREVAMRATETSQRAASASQRVASEVERANHLSMAPERTP